MPSIPELSEIRARVQNKLGQRACLWQLQVVQAILKHDKDVVCIAGTGSGKTLTFWMPLLFRPDGIQIVITPINILGDQNTGELKRLGISGIALNKTTASPANIQAIEDGKYRVVTTNPEILMNRFDKLWKNEAFTSKIISIVWDEAHCVSTWADFREEYRQCNRLRHIMPRTIPFYLPSATLPPPVLNDVMATLQVSHKNTRIIQRPNDRPNIRLVVHKMRYAANSFGDLDFLIPDDWTPEKPLPKFLVFFDSIAESIKATKYLQARLARLGGSTYKNRVVWFNSDMSDGYRADKTEDLRNGYVVGMPCTDSFGMGIDLKDIGIIVQWKATCDMCTLWQRFGRGARDFRLTATAVFLVEPKHFDDEKKKGEDAKIKRAEQKKRKALKQSNNEGPSKKQAIGARAPRAVLHTSQVPNITTTITAHVQPEVEDSDEDEIDGTTDNYDELRVSYHHTTTDVAKNFRNKAPKVVEPAMDDLINAATRHPFKCHRIPFMIFFGNDKLTSDHMACAPDLPTGCSRCIIAKPSVCCMLCNPDSEEFNRFAVVDCPKPPRPPARSRIKKGYKLEPSDIKLREALNEFREQGAEEIFGWAKVQDSGPGFFMSDEVLGRILDCSHYDKIDSVEALAKETHWWYCNEYGTKVVDIIKSNRPQRPAPEPRLAVSLLTRSSEATGSAPASTRRLRQCRACGSQEHIASNKLCPKHPSRTRNSVTVPSNENIAATSTSIPAPSPAQLHFSHAQSLISRQNPQNSFSFVHVFPGSALYESPVPRTSPTSLPNLSPQPSRHDSIDPNQFYASSSAHNNE